MLKLVLIRNYLMFVVLLIFWESCYSNDYGVHGETFEIIERDVRLVFMESAARANWGGVNDKFIEQAESFYKDLPSRSFDPVYEVITRKLEVKSIATRDIVAPIVVDNEIKWVAIVEKGDEASFDEYFPLNIAVLLINLNNDDEVEIGKRIVDEYKGLIDIVSLSGNPKDYMEYFGRAVFFASDEFLSTYDINHSPTLIYRSKRDKESILVSSFPSSYGARDILEVVEQ